MARRAPTLLDPKLVDCSMVGSLGQEVFRVLDVVDRSRVHFTRFEILRDRLEQVWRDLTSFLSLSQEIVPSSRCTMPATGHSDPGLAPVA